MVDLTRSDDGTFRPGVPFGLPEGFQWIWSQTGHSVPHPSSKEAPWERPRRSAIRPRWTSPELPDRLLLKSFLEVYMRSPMRRIFPVIDPAFFPQTIEAAYSHTNPPNIRNHSAHACILTFMALVSSLHPFDPTYNGAHLPSIPRDSYVAHASTLLPAIIQGPLNLDSLQAAILLVNRP